MAERMNTIKLNSWRAKTSQEKLAIEIINLFHKAGFRHTYIVGGYVRDLLLKRPETGTIDIAGIAIGCGLSLVYFILGLIALTSAFDSAKKRGLINLY